MILKNCPGGGKCSQSGGREGRTFLFKKKPPLLWLLVVGTLQLEYRRGGLGAHPPLPRSSRFETKGLGDTEMGVGGSFQACIAAESFAILPSESPRVGPPTVQSR